jgi:DNA-binding ferritin-like protein
MTGSQFTALLTAIEDVRKDLSAKLDAIDERLRTVEVDQAKASAIVESDKEETIGVQWKVGIAVSAVGVVATLIVSLLP